MEIDRDYVMQLTLMADAAFQIAFRGNLEGSERLARMVLRRDDIRIISADTQRELQSIEGHLVELDLLAEDAEDRSGCPRYMCSLLFCIVVLGFIL